jgi:hypothetical protein
MPHKYFICTVACGHWHKINVRPQDMSSPSAIDCSKCGQRMQEVDPFVYDDFVDDQYGKQGVRQQYVKCPVCGVVYPTIGTQPGCPTCAMAQPATPRSSWKIPPRKTYYSQQPPSYQGATQVPPSSYQQQSTAKCRIWYDLDVQAYYISTPYSEQFVNFIKIAIPVSDRGYDPSTKHWTFTEKWFDVVLDLSKKVWRNPGEVVCTTKDQAEKQAQAQQAQQNQRATSAPVHKAPLDNVYAEFMKLISFDAANAAYRKAALEFHPDRNNGQDEKMSHLNSLFTRIKEEKQKSV